MEASKQEIEIVAGQLDDLVKDMDNKLNRVLKRQEQDYLKGYSIYVREKERELRELVVKINERNQQSNLKDEIIQSLKHNLKHNYDHAIKTDQIVREFHVTVQTMQTKYDALETDRNFLQT